MQRLPIDAYTLFGQEFLSSMLGIEENFAITDVVAADKVFEQVALQYVPFFGIDIDYELNFMQYVQIST